MSSKTFKSISFCVGGRHRSAAVNIYGDIPKGSEVVIGHCSICNRDKSLTVSDNTIVEKNLGDFSKSLVKKRLNASKNMAKHVLKIPVWALDIKANVASAIVSRNPQAASSTLPEVINFFHTGNGLHLGKLVIFLSV